MPPHPHDVDFDQQQTALVGPAQRAGTEPRRGLRVVMGIDAGMELPLGRREITIGRGSLCDLQLTDATVSRVHARLERREGQWVLCDGSSINGTHLNGKKIDGQQALLPGDTIRIGKTSIRYLDCDVAGLAQDPDATAVKPALNLIPPVHARESAVGSRVRPPRREPTFDPDESIEAALAVIARLEADESDIIPLRRRKEPPPHPGLPGLATPPPPPPGVRPSAIGRPVDLPDSQLPRLLQPDASNSSGSVFAPPPSISDVLRQRILFGSLAGILAMAALLLLS